MNICECGCGQLCKRIFIRGHNRNQLGQIPWNKGIKTGPQTEEHRRKNSEALMGHPVSEETIRKILHTKSLQPKVIRRRKPSQAQLDALLLGRTTRKNKWSTPTKYKGIQMRSKLEARYAKSLDKRKIKWTYEPEKFWLEELGCYYIPDFYLPETNAWTEVKGWEQGLDKVAAFRKLGNSIKVIRKDDF